MPWPKGVQRVEGLDGDTVRPTAIARAIYQPLQVYCQESGRPLRAVIEQAILEMLMMSEEWQVGNPPEPGWYLVTVDQSGKRLTTMAHWWGDPTGWQMLSKNEEFAPVAWKPRPEPYQL
jgi:hypothetical protein